MVLLVALFFVQNTLSKAERINHQMNNVHLPALTLNRNLLLSIEQSFDLAKQWAYVQRNEDHIERRTFIALCDSVIPNQISAIQSLHHLWSEKQKEEWALVIGHWKLLNERYTKLRETLCCFDSYNDPMNIIMSEDLFLQGTEIPFEVERTQFLLQNLLKQFKETISEERESMDQSFADLYHLLSLFGVIIILLGITIAYFTSQSITSRVRKIRRSLKKLSLGIYGQEELPKFNDEIGDMGTALEKLKQNFERTKNFATEIGKGNLDASFEPLSKDDDMGHALLRMKEDLSFYRHRMEEKVAEQTQEITLQKNTAEAQKEKIQSLYADLKSSISYAKRLQDSILPDTASIQKIFPEHFILYLPKDVVSGDFYWFQQQGNKKLFAAADCTGHGVPGAFMSLIAHNALNHVTKVYTKPGQILNQVNRIATSAFNTNNENQIKDGMDIALCSVDYDNMVLEFSGAQNDAVIIRDGQLIEIKGDKKSIGNDANTHNLFTTQVNSIQKNDMVFVFSDGYADQFGGAMQKKFMRKMLKELLTSIATETHLNQREKLLEAFHQWKGENEQTDDVLIIGIRV
jgi:serine phosphatase RsbU (regulator of sigma subunit)/HAMP domain-containing protein